MSLIAWLLLLSLQSVLQFLKGAFFNARDVRARDIQCSGDLALRLLLDAAKTVAHHYDLSLARTQAGVDKVHHFSRQQLAVDLLGNVFLTANYVNVGQGIAVAVHVDRVIDRDLGRKLLLGTKVHQDLIRYPHLTARKNPLNFRWDFCRNCRCLRSFRWRKSEIRSYHRCGRGKGVHFHRPKRPCG